MSHQSIAAPWKMVSAMIYILHLIDFQRYIVNKLETLAKMRWKGGLEDSTAYCKCLVRMAWRPEWPRSRHLWAHASQMYTALLFFHRLPFHNLNINYIWSAQCDEINSPLHTNICTPKPAGLILCRRLHGDVQQMYAGKDLHIKAHWGPP